MHGFGNRGLRDARIALFRRQSGADAVVFVNDVTDHQRAVLEELFGCPVLSAVHLPGKA